MVRQSSSNIIGAVLTIIAILVGVFVWQPMRDEALTKQTDLTEQQAVLATIEADITQLMDLEAQLPVAESERERILSAVPVGVNQDDLVEGLATIADDVGVTLNSMTYSTQVSQDSAAKIVTISANFTGAYDDLVTLLKSLEDSDRLLKTTVIGVQVGEVTDSGYSMNFSVTLEGYYQD